MLEGVFFACFFVLLWDFFFVLFWGVFLVVYLLAWFVFVLGFVVTVYGQLLSKHVVPI